MLPLLVDPRARREFVIRARGIGPDDPRYPLRRCARSRDAD
jgi:hypothetical protein